MNWPLIGCAYLLATVAGTGAGLAARAAGRRFAGRQFAGWVERALREGSR